MYIHTYIVINKYIYTYIKINIYTYMFKLMYQKYYEIIIYQTPVCECLLKI